jgi:ABC-type uncharacterized transport system involved in gliding motility auxiliary subunit
MAGGIKNWDRRTLGIAGLAMAAVFLVSLLVFSTEALRNATVDLTEAKVFTLSDGTKEVLSDIREPVTLRMFVTEELMEQSPALKDYARSVQELLERYAELSNGRIKLEIIHPEPFSPEEDRAVGFGLHGVPITQAGNLGYFGLAGTNTTDDLDTIAFFTPQRESFLEYDLSRLVQNLANPKKKKVGVVTSLPMDADPLKRYRPWQIIEQLRQFFDVQKITLEDPVPEDIDVLMVVHPRDMDDTDRYYIDQHIMRGGKAIIYVDPYSEEATRGNAMQRQPPDDGSDLKKLFEAYGIVYDKNKVLGDRKGAQRVSAGRDALGRPVITDYLAWVTLTGNQVNGGDVVTSDLEQITLASSGFFSKAKDATYEIQPLLMSSPDAMAIDVAKVKKDPEPARLLRDFKAAGEPFIVAARITGSFRSAFPDGPPKDKIREDIETARIKKGEKVPPKQKHLKESARPASMIVVADTDMLVDRFWVRSQDFFGQRVDVPFANNADFLSNAVDNMAGTAALIGLRSRGVTARPFHKVEELKSQAELRYRSTEQALLEKLKDIESKLKDIQTKETSEGKTVILSREQKEAVEKFRRESIAIRKELRSVQLALRQDIDELERNLKIINIGLMPAVIIVFAIGLGLVRRRNAQRHRATALARS